MSIKSGLLIGVSGLGFFWASSVGAQQSTVAVQATEPVADPAGRQAASNDPSIVVTGTRIHDPNAKAASPIVSVTAEELRKSGETNVSEVLRELPALVNSIPLSNSFEGTGFGSIGLATLDLRGLGANRTLVLVNGRRHVSGEVGQQSVDVGSIPIALIDRVDVLTGGASSIYGADAVTGVVNFVLKRKYQGIDVRAQAGISGKGDGGSFLVDAVWGKNFAHGRGNIVLAAGYEKIEETRENDRDFLRNNARAFPLSNPDLRFQKGEISSTATPNFAQFYDFDYGAAIPSVDAFLAAYAAKFPGAPAPTLTSAELALIARAQNAPPMALIYDPRGSISDQGLISRADNQPFNLDLNGNGVPDCLDSFRGFNNHRCYVTTPGGGVRVYQDGSLIVAPTLQSGGDGQPFQSTYRTLSPGIQRFNMNLLGSFELAEAAELFGEFKFVRSDIKSHEPYYSFTTGVQLLPDNPFIPQALQADAQAAGGLILRRDQNSDLGPNEPIKTRRDTYRAVLGLRGDLLPNLNYEVAGVYGRTSVRESRPKEFVDRYFAALDVVQGPNGQPVCRSDVDSNSLPPGDPFSGQPGFVSFNPGDGSCVPVNPFNGTHIFSDAAANWILGRTVDRYHLEQYVLSGQLSGDTRGFFNLPGGPVRFAAGAEYRKEKSWTDYDPLTLGMLPVTSPAGPAGSLGRFFFLGHSPNQSGSFDVREVFGEVEIPILADRSFFQDLRLGGAARYSNYGGGASGVGNTFTWSANAVYAPIRDIRFRGTYSKAVRAPNISELFEPVEEAKFFQIEDPCAAAQIALLPADDPRRVNRIANCAAAGVPVDFVQDTAGIKGETGGNVGLTAERAKTFTVGAVLQPRFLPGFTASVDYYNIKIKGAIGAVSAQDIVNSCYNSSGLNNQYCSHLSRDTDPSSLLFHNINFISSGQINFGRLETAGVDAAIGYNFALGKNQFALRGNATWVRKHNVFFDPADPSAVNVRLGESGYPKWSGIGSATYGRGRFSLTYRVQYIGSVAIPFIEVEDAEALFGPGKGFVHAKLIHNASATFKLTERVSLYGGVNNLTYTKPYPVFVSYPVSGVGRFFFFGARATFQ